MTTIDVHYIRLCQTHLDFQRVEREEKPQSGLSARGLGLSWSIVRFLRYSFTTIQYSLFYSEDPKPTFSRPVSQPRTLRAHSL